MVINSSFCPTRRRSCDSNLAGTANADSRLHSFISIVCSSIALIAVGLALTLSSVVHANQPAPLLGGMTAFDGGSQVSPVSVTKLDGQTLTGDLIELSQESALLVADSVEQRIPAEEIGTVLFPSNDSLAKLPMSLVTIDGSEVRATIVEGDGASWTIDSHAFKLNQSLTAKQLHYLKLREIDANAEQDWMAAVLETSQSDGVVLRRPSGEIAKIGGTISRLKDQVISFDFDGQAIDMPITRLLGVVWYQLENPRLAAGVEVVSSDGSKWNAQTFRLTDGAIELETAAKVSVSIPVNHMVEIRFGAANVGWVMEAERLSASVESNEAWDQFPALGSAPQQPSAASGLGAGSANSSRSGSNSPIGQIFAPQFISSVSSPNASSPAEYDLRFKRPGTYEFRMPDGFRSLQTIVERTGEGDLQSTVTIQVWQDSDAVFDQTLSLEEDSLEVKVDLEPGKRTRLVVTRPTQSLIGTEVQWKQPRLLK